MPTNRDEIQQLKVLAGRAPFDERVRFDADGHAPCPFHGGDGQKSMHLQQKESGAWVATCFSACGKSFDALAFVQQFDKLGFKDALERIQPKPGAPAPPPPPPKKKAAPLTRALWEKWGSPVTEDDVARFAKARPHSASPSFEWFQRNCRVKRNVPLRDGGKGDFFGLPYWLDDTTCFMLKMRRVDAKDFLTEHKVSYEGLSNLAAVNPFDDVYVVEGDIGDVGVLADAGFTAVSVVTGKQDKFEPAAIKKLCEAPRIFLVGDQAKAGETDPGPGCMDALQKLLPEDKTFRIRFDEAHDVGELAKKTDLASRIERLSEAALVPWAMRNIPRIHQLSDAPLKWVIDRFLPYGGLALVSGQAGAQKSYLAMMAAQCISGRDTFLGRGVLMERQPSRIGMPVMYLDRENPESEVNERRRKLGISGNADFAYWGDWNRNDGPPPAEPDDPRLLELASRGVYIIFDSLQQWIGDAEENSNVEMVQLMNRFKHLARIGPGVLILHHHGRVDIKTGKSRTRGASAIVAVSDMAFNVRKDEDNMGAEKIEIRPERFRLCGPWEIDFKINFVSKQSKYTHTFELLRDEEPAQIMRRKSDEKSAAEVAEKATETADLNRIAEVIKNNPKISVNQLSRETGIQRTHRLPRMLEKGCWSKDTGEWVCSAKPPQECEVADDGCLPL